MEFTVPVGDRRNLAAPTEEPETNWEWNLDALSYGIQRQNPLSKYAADAVHEYMSGGVTPEFAYDPDYDFTADSANFNYPPSQVSQARSANEAAYIRAQIDRERQQMEVINSSAWGTTGELFGAIAQPQHLAAAMVAPQSLTGALMLEGGVELGTEFMLHEQQRTRTKVESALNVGGALAGTAFLGGAFKLYGKYNNGQSVMESTVASRQARSEADSAGAMKTYERGIYDDDGNLVMSGSEAQSMVGGKLAEALSLGPNAAVLKSSDEFAKAVTLSLVDNPFYLKGMDFGQTSGPAAESFVQSALGRAAITGNELSDIAKKANKESGISEEDFLIEVGNAMSRGDVSPNPHVQSAAQRLRKDMDEFLEELKDVNNIRLKEDYLSDIQKLEGEIDQLKNAKPKPGQVPQKALLESKLKELEMLKRGMDNAPVSMAKWAQSYFPRVYRRDAVIKNWAGLKSKLAARYMRDIDGMTIDEANDAALEVMQNILGGGTSRSVGGVKPSATKERVLSLSDEELMPYMERNAKAVHLNYVRSMAPYIEAKKALGGRTIDEITAQLNANKMRKMDAATSQAEKNAIAKEYDRLEQDIRRMYDRLMNNVQRSIDPSNSVEKVIAWTKLTNMLAQLGGIVFSSIPDFARPIMHHGFTSFATGVAQSMRQMAKGIGSAESIQVKRTGAAIQRALNSRLSEISDSGVGGRIFDKMQRAGGRWTGFDRYTDMVESIAANTAMDWVLRQANKVAAGKTLSKNETRKLARMGFTDEDLKVFHREAMATGGAKDPVLKFANSLAWGDTGMAKKFEAGIGSDVRRTIVRLGHGDKPRFMDDSLWSLLLQYQSFGVASTNKLLVAGFQNFDLATAQGLLSMVFLGSAVGTLKGTMRGEDVSEWSAEQFVMEGVDRSGLAGVYNIPFNIMRYVGAQAGLLESQPTRYLHREIESVLGGPTISQLGRAARVFTSAVEGDSEKAMDNFIRLLPFNDALHVRSVLEMMAED